MTVDSLRTERGHELKKLRKSKGITQEALSKVSGIALATIIRIERGKKNYGIDNELRIRAVLGLMPDKQRGKQRSTTQL